jgi:hypothetical protein
MCIDAYKHRHTHNRLIQAQTYIQQTHTSTDIHVTYKYKHEANYAGAHALMHR